MTAVPAAIPAATLVLFRDRAAGPPDLLFVERARAMVFAGGALVFPGGRIDPGDHALAATLDRAFDDAAARIAAVRETLEEAGVAIGLPPLPAGTLAAVRDALHRGVVIGDALTAHRLTLDLDALVPFARWCPSHPERRVFDTHFYLARWPENAAEPSVDGSENVRLLWSSAQGVLDAADAGRAHIIFPTRRNLERLAQFDSFAAAAAHAAAVPIRTVTPWAEQRGGVEHLCIPDDLGYPVTSQPLAEAVRG